MRSLFLGPARFWLIWAAVIGTLVLAGQRYLHVSAFGSFLALLGVLAVGCVLWIVFGTRAGERITREPIDGGPDVPGRE